MLISRLFASPCSPGAAFAQTSEPGCVLNVSFTDVVQLLPDVFQSENRVDRPYADKGGEDEWREEEFHHESMGFRFRVEDADDDDHNDFTQTEDDAIDDVWSKPCRTSDVDCTGQSDQHTEMHEGYGEQSEEDDGVSLSLQSQYLVGQRRIKSGMCFQ